MTDLPGLTYGRVVGRFMTIIGDTIGDGGVNPDAVPTQGTVMLTPIGINTFHKVTLALPDPVTATLRPITATISNGYLSFQSTDPDRVFEPFAIASEEVFGVPEAFGGSVAPPGIISEEAFGIPVISGGVPVVSPTGIASAEAIGTPQAVNGMGLWLVATDDPVINSPLTFRYLATFDLQHDGEIIPVPARIIEIPTGTTYDLGADLILPNTNIVRIDNADMELPGSAGSPVTGFFANNVTATQSTDWVNSGTYSMKLTPTSAVDDDSNAIRSPTTTLPAGRAYTCIVKLRLSAAQTGTLNAFARTMEVRAYGAGTFSYPSSQAPNAVGVYELRATFLSESGGVEVYLWNGALLGGGDVWYDDLVLVEVPSISEPYTGPVNHFDIGHPYYL